MNSAKTIGEELASRLPASVREELALEPFDAIPRLFGLEVVTMPPGRGDDDCSCDGALTKGRKIVVAETPFSRRSGFTALHELGHELLHNDGELYAKAYSLHPQSDGRVSEERVCDAFAAMVLIPPDLVDRVVLDNRPKANHLVQLFEVSHGSREACAVRLAERLRCDGHIMLAHSDGTAIFTASAGPYSVARGTSQGEGHITVVAARRGEARHETFVRFRTGKTMPMWGDAVRDGRFVYAVLAASPQWEVEGPTIHQDALDRATPTEFHCESCDTTFETFAKPCDKCGVGVCPNCERCACGSTADDRLCKGCWMLLAPALFPPGSDRCRDCS